MKRRSFLKGTGAVTVAVVGGAVWRAYETGVFSVATGPAYEPWTTWRTDGEGGPLALVRAGILAANPFNTQPWLFHVADSSIEVYADNARNTGGFDPFLRELRIGLGCAIENMMQAAAANGLRATVTLTPGVLGPPAGRPARELVARLELMPGPTAETELYRAIPDRHTNRSLYDVARAVPPGVVAELQRVGAGERDTMVQLFTSDADKARFVDMCTQSVLADAGDADARNGTARWTRDWHGVERLHDGAYVDDAGLSPIAAAAAKFFPPAVLALLQGGHPTDLPTIIKREYTDRLLTGRLFGLIAVRDLYDQEQSIRAGQVWQRSHLLATARGLAARPANQPVQLVDHERMHGQPAREAAILAELTGDAAWRPTFMFFMGYATRPATPSARRGVTEVVI